jgi:predicted RNase H-like nuclease
MATRGAPRTKSRGAPPGLRIADAADVPPYPGCVLGRAPLVAGSVRVLGIDACPAGWVGVAVGPDGVQAYVAELVADLVSVAAADGPLDAVGVDIPIGLPEDGPRAADELAAAAIGSLRSSVFTTPVREALRAPDHATAVAINRRLAGFGISVQAYGLRHRIFEVEEWVSSTALTVREVHPEVSFAQLAGAPLVVRKSTWAGVERRRELLDAAGIHLAGDLGLAGRAAKVDDVLDAAAAAWTARRIADGTARPLPDPPETFSDAWPAAIWV